MAAKPSPVLRHPERCVCYELRKLTRSVTALYDAVIGEAGLRATQYTILSQVDGLGGCTLGELSKVSMTDQTTLTRNVQILHRRGLISFVPSKDRRFKRIEVSPAGRKLIVRAFEAWQEAQGRLKARVGTVPLSKLLSCVKEVNRAMRRSDV